MRNVRVKIPASYDLTKAAKLIERLSGEEGLTQTMKTSLKGYPRSVHLHYKKKGGESGTLEITLRPDDSNIWFSVHDNRKGTWTFDCADRLALATRKALKSSKK